MNFVIFAIDLDNKSSTLIQQLTNIKYSFAPFQESVIYFNSDAPVSDTFSMEPNQYQLDAFAGQSTLLYDGSVKIWVFHQLVAVFSELDKSSYIRDSQTNLTKIVTPTSETKNFLTTDGILYKTFSIHEKGNSYSIELLDESKRMAKQENILELLATQ